MYDYQVTIYCKSGKYRCISTIVHKKNLIDLTDKDARKQLITDGTIKICQNKGWTARNLVENDYLTAKVRAYQKGATR